jgi:hypothetical protein
MGDRLEQVVINPYVFPLELLPSWPSDAPALHVVGWAAMGGEFSQPALRIALDRTPYVLVQVSPPRNSIRIDSPDGEAQRDAEFGVQLLDLDGHRTPPIVLPDGTDVRAVLGDVMRALVSGVEYAATVYRSTIEQQIVTWANEQMSSPA